ncbi:MAG: YggS family pyridoxal phosphate-dependent enzyme [Candidatus Kinetoplastibacterium crithidii]|nr:MAG: YggS family pyridoxal phosphate-dependent enzyme [Candidatus Kinetoplastibacterium crithidii]
MNNDKFLEERLESINERITKTCQRTGCDKQISILPVSKTFNSEIIAKTIQVLKMKRFGENRAQEIKTKYHDLLEHNIEWVMIGNLQLNKVNSIINCIGEIQSLDRLELAKAINNQLQKNNKTIKALVQIKTSPEPTKHGIYPDDLLTFLQKISDNFPRIKISGLMTVAELTEDKDKIRSCFRTIRKLRDKISKYNIASVNMDNLSMGMSKDFEIAIEEGSTEIRLGSILFGHR